MQASFGGGNSPINSTDGSVGKACKPAVDGGKGIRPISIKNQALLTKLAYKTELPLSKNIKLRKEEWMDCIKNHQLLQISRDRPLRLKR